MGMGLGNPAMNALMFLVSEPRFKGVNSNLMTMALQMGNSLGPVLGAAASHHAGYRASWPLTWPCAARRCAWCTPTRA